MPQMPVLDDSGAPQKPAFDPNKPFQAGPAVSAKPKFDPSKAFEPSIDEPMPGESYKDYMQRTYLPSVLQKGKDIYNVATHVGENIPILGPLATKAAEGTVGYLMGDDAQQKVHEGNQAASKEFKEQHPVADLAASGVGAAMLPAPFAAAKGLAGVGARVGTGAAESAADAAARGQNPIKAAEDAGVIGTGLELALGSAGKVGKALKNSAESGALKAATGGASLGYLKDAAKSGRVALEENGQLSSKAGRALLEADEAGPAIVGPLTKTSEIAPKVAHKAQFYGEKIGEVGAAIDKVYPKAVSGEEIAKNIESYAESLPKLSDYDNIRENLAKSAEEYRAKGFIGFKEAQEYKNAYKFSHVDHPIFSDAQTAKKLAVGKAMDDTAETIAQSAAAKDNPSVEHLIDQYKYYKDKYGTYTPIADASMARVLKDQNNRIAQPSDMATGLTVTGGLLAKGVNPITAAASGVGAGAVHKFGRDYGRAFSANAADALSKMLQENPSALGKYRQVLEEAAKKGNANLALTHYLLSKQDPEYQQTITQGVQ